MKQTARILAALALVAGFATSAVAVPCKSSRQLKLRFDGKKGQGQLLAAAYGCALPAACPVEPGTPATKLPLKISLVAGDATLFQTDVRGCDDPKACLSMNSAGCKSGGDAHRAPNGLMKLTYHPRGLASLMVRARGPMTKPAYSGGPLTLRVVDAAGYAVEASFEKCRVSDHGSNSLVVCH